MGRDATSESPTRIMKIATSFLLAMTTTVMGLKTTSAEQAIPFVQALDRAAISVERLDSITEQALIIGNGDINALVYSDSGNLELVLTKNDVWDARLDTTLDPPLPTLARIKELARGKWPNRTLVLPKGSTWEGPDSYHANPYPCPRACARLVMGANKRRPKWRQVRAQGQHNTWTFRDNAGIMSIKGGAGASNGWEIDLPDVSTDDYTTLRVTLSGSANAQYYIDVMDAWNKVIFATKWQTTPLERETCLFALPSGQQADSVILYTQTIDGNRAQNQFKSILFEGSKGRLALDLDSTPSNTSPASLDIRRAVARVKGGPGGPVPATIRALAQQNSFLIDADIDARLEQFQTADTPDAKTGETNGVRWLHQIIPGDLDWPGMEYAVALAQVGSRKVVTIVTSLEAPDVVKAAVQGAQAVMRTQAAELVARHEAIWNEFWTASGLDVDDELMEQTWYRGLYFLRCVSKPGVVPPGLFASLTTGSPAWHGDYHTNYNIQQTFWGCYAANHPELAEPYDRLISGYATRAKWLARTVFDMQGAFYPHVLYAYEPNDPAQVKSPVGRQYIHHVWGFTLGVSAFTVQPLWWHYKYQPERDFLEQTAYPAVRDVAIFYADFIDQCERQGNRVILAPSVSPEHWGWTDNFQRNRNGTFDISMAQFVFSAAIEGATTLQCDTHLVTRWQQARALLPDYPTTQTETPVVVDVEGAEPINYNITVPATPVFPADIVTWQAPAAQRTLFKRTIDSIQWNGNNSMVMLGVARARLDMPDTLDWMREEVQSRLRPNGSLTLNRRGARFNEFGHYTEQFAATMVLSELLIQSVDDVIRVFPVWPRERDARFCRLRTQGGVLVSSDMKSGKIDRIEIASTVGGPLRIVSPWKQMTVCRSGQMSGRSLVLDAQGIAKVSTEPGDRFTFTEKISNDKPVNVVFILVDDLGWADIGCYGSRFYETPNIDKLAATGMRFTDAYAAAPVCSPTRASIMSGKYPARIDTTEWFGGPQPDGYKRNTKLVPAHYHTVLPLEEKTIAETLKDAGYATFFAGKWHLGHEGYWPEKQGFDINKGGWTRGGPYGGKKYFSPYGNPRLQDGPNGEHLPDRLATETVKFMAAHQGQPFLAYLSFYSVHTPLISREDLLKKYQEKQKTVPANTWGKEGQKKVRQVQNHAVYAGMVEAMDLAVGKVLDGLKRLGLEDDTVVFFMSDNGGVATDGGWPTSNLPLRGGKGWLYEGGIREPMIVRWPGVTEPGSVCREPVTSTDFYPTMLDMVGIPLVHQQHVDGVSLTPLLHQAGPLQRKAIYWHYPHYSGGLGGRPGSAVRMGDYKLIEFYEDSHLELYNLAEDIGEHTNLLEKEPNMAQEMHALLKQWRQDVDAKMPSPNSAYKE